jgi:hypothetical protein
MTPERLRQLADTWGADLRRWPEAERAGAQALLAHDAAAQALLRRAAELDALLDAHAVAAPDARLAQAVLAGAPRQDIRQRPAGQKAKAWPFPGRWWWSGAGLAGIGLAGSAVGAMAVAMALSTVVPAPGAASAAGTWASTVFDSGSGAEWSEE